MTKVVTGNVVLKRNPEKDTESTGPQIYSMPLVDSRLSSPNRGALTVDRIRELRKDPTVSLAKQAVVAPMIHTAWYYEETDKAPEGALELVRSNLEPLRDWFLQNAVYGSLDFGWAPFELIYKVVNKQTVLSKVKQLLQDYTDILVYLDDGDFAGFINYPIHRGPFGGGTTGFGIKIDKKFALNINLVVEGTDWYGQSIYETLEDTIDNWDTVEDAANRYDAKISGASWVVHYPVGETIYNEEMTANDEIARDILSKLQASGGIAIPDEVQEFIDDDMDKDAKGKWRVDLIYVQNSAQSNFVDRQKYLDALKVRAFGLPERSLLEGTFGTKAEAETMVDVALSTIDTKHRLITNQMNREVVNKLLRFNWGEEALNTVTIKPAPIIDSQFQSIKEIYRLIIQSPQTIQTELENLNVPAIREELGLPSHLDAPNDYTKPEPQPNPFLNNEEELEEEEEEEENEE